MNFGGFKAFKMDIKCLIGTVVSVARFDGVVEGGTGELNKESEEKETISVK